MLQMCTIKVVKYDFLECCFLCISDLLCFTNYFVSIGHIAQV